MRHSWVCFIQLKITKCEYFFSFVRLCFFLVPVYCVMSVLHGDIVCRYGYLTNTKVKFILVTTDLDVKDADVRNVSMALSFGPS